MERHLFEAFGIELEYMIVNRSSLDILPIADRLLAAAAAGDAVADVERGKMAWSNELVLHVIEFKTNGPAASLEGLHRHFDAEVQTANALLAAMDARLMPAAAHPWMDPANDTHLWPHANNAIYQAYNRIFGCQGHGWSNLQSMHINLPFANDAEFGRLHAAIRLLLPLMPALAASSPLLEGRPTPFLDARMEVYCHNSQRIPSVAGYIIPEAVYSRQDYDSQIMQPMFRDIEPFDAEGVLKHEFLNARGAIARFDRSAIEIRVLDVQECPRADLALADLICSSIRGLVDELWVSSVEQQQWATAPLAAILQETIRQADLALIPSADYGRVWGLRGPGPWRAGDIWQHLFETPAIHNTLSAESIPSLNLLFRQGCLARRILKALNQDYRKPQLRAVYTELCNCLAKNQLFTA